MIVGALAAAWMAAPREADAAGAAHGYTPTGMDSMGNTVRKGFTLVMTALVLTACQDSPTASRPLDDSGNARVVMLETMIVTAATGCTDATWTRGDDGVCRSSRGTTDEETKPSGGGGGGGADGTGGPTTPPEEEDGPIMFAACMAAMIGAAVSLPVLDYYIKDLYEAASAYDKAQREYLRLAVPESNTDPLVLKLYEARRDDALRRYHDSKSAMVIATGTTLTVVGIAAVTCAPSMLLPTP